MRGTLRGNFPLHHFPFDEPTLGVQFELPAQYGTLVPDLASSGMRETFSLSDWHYKAEFSPETSRQVFGSDLGNLDHEGRPSTVHNVGFNVTLSRPIRPVILKLFLPLAIILLVALVSLFIAPSQIEARSAMGVTALLSCFAFQFTVSDSLPEVAYLTLADSLFILAYVVTTLVVVETTLSYVLDGRGRESWALGLDRASRILLPIGAAIAVAVALPADDEPSPIEPEPPAELTRHESARDVLRIGTTILPAITGSVGSFASRWGLVHEDPVFGDQNIYIERRPGVNNELVRFLAGGEIEVTWRIREDSKWSDGEPLTARDIEFAFELNPDANMIEFRRVSDREVTLRWDDRLARALEAPDAMPAHVLASVASTPSEEGEPGGYEAVRAHQKEHPTPSLGPYRVAEFVKDERLVAEANPHFLGSPPNISRLEMTRYADSAALRAAFEAGEVDITQPNGVTVEDALAVAETRPDSVNMEPSAVFVFLAPDLNHPLLGQLEVRRALLAAIDRPALASAAYPGRTARVAHTCVPAPEPEDVEHIAFDPDFARTELARLGANGMTLPLLFRETPRDTPILDRIVEQLAAVGVTLERTPVQRTLPLWRSGDHGGLLMHVLRSRREADPRRYFQVPMEDGSYVASARHSAFDDRAANLVERELRALYPERRTQLREQLFTEFSRSLPYLPLLFAPERVLVDPALRDWQRGPEVAFGLGIERAWFQ